MSLIRAVKNFKWGYLFIAVILCASGICFIAYPSQSMTAVSYIIGAFTLIGAIVQFVKILSDKKRGFSFAVQILTTVLTAICGAIAIIIPETVAAYYPMFIGLFIVIDGAFKLQTVISAKRYNLKMWWFLLILACLTIVFGFMLIRVHVPEENIRPFTFLLGCGLFLTGIQNFFSLFFLSKIVKRESYEIVNAYKNGANVIEDPEFSDKSEKPLSLSEENISFKDTIKNEIENEK